MARKRRKVHEGPLNPYPQRPHRPGIYVLYIDWKDRDISGVSIYSAAFGARKHLDILLQGLEREVITEESLIGLIDDKQVLVASNGIRIRCSRLQEVLDHVYSPEEEAWQMETRHVRDIERFRYGEAQTDKDETPSDDIRTLNKKARRSKRRKEKSSARPKKSREVPAGTVTVAMIAESLNIAPREARARLRKSEVTKPDSGWQWPEDEAKEIEELIAKG